MAEHGRGDAAIVDGRRLVAEHGVGERLPLADRDGGQLDAVGDVADGVDRLDARLVVGADHDRALGVQLDPDFGEAQAVGVGDAAGGEEDAVDLHIVMVGHADLEAAVGLLLDPAEFGVEAEIDALGHRNLQQPVADLLVIAAQDDIRAVDQRHLAAELVEDPGEFIGDIARARDQHAPRQGVEVEHLVRGDAMFVAGAGGDQRARADRDQDLAGGDFPAAGQRDFVRAGDGGAFVDDLDPVAVERVGVGTVEPVDLRQDIVAQHRPVEIAFGHVPAKAARVVQILGEMRAIDEQLLGHAAADDAGAADAIFLGNRDLRAVGGGNAGGADAAGACTDDEEVVVVIGHWGLLLGRRSGR